MSIVKNPLAQLDEIFQNSPIVVTGKFIVSTALELIFSMLKPWLRRGMGEEDFSLFYIALMSIAILVLCKLFKVDPFYISWYLGLTALLSTCHLIVIFQRNRKGIIFHSFFSGYSNLEPLIKWLPYSKNEWIRDGLYEPLIVLLVSFLVQLLLDDGLANLMQIAAFCMVLRTRFHYWLYRKELLKMRNAQIESQYAMDALNGKPASETAGFVVKNVHNLRPSDKDILKRKAANDKDFASLSA